MRQENVCDRIKHCPLGDDEGAKCGKLFILTSVWIAILTFWQDWNSAEEGRSMI